MTAMRHPALVRLHPREDSWYVSQGRTVLLTDGDGFIGDQLGHGLFVYQTRMLSHYRYLIDGQPPHPVALSSVEQHSWLGYYIVPHETKQPLSEERLAPSEQVTEMCLARFVGEGFHEDVDLTNYTQKPLAFELALEVDADFIDQREARKNQRLQNGTLNRVWRPAGASGWELAFDYHAERSYSHQGEKGTARIHRGLVLRVLRASSPVAWQDGRITFRVELAPGERWHACLEAIPVMEGRPLPLHYSCHSFVGTHGEYDGKRHAFLAGTTTFRTPGDDTLTAVVGRALDQARHDLAALRLYDLDHGADAWTLAAGLPVYVGLFGRDTQLSSWQAGPCSADLLRGTLAEWPRWQGTRIDDWRDEQPGRMPHQIQEAPLSALNFNPLGRYYGTMSSSLFYAEALYGLWLWTGDRERVERFLEPALKGLRWLDEYGDLDGDGFYEYQQRSTKGLKNQAWKDSGVAIVWEDGSQVPDPIAAVEVQGLAYIARSHLAQILRWLGRDDEARRLDWQAEELKKRFNDVFWMEDEGYYLMGLGPGGRPIRSISSDAGACLAAGIVDHERARRVADRLLAPDMFSGWGVRTLSAQHPAYNPFSYQRGSVWPVENGILALAFLRYGLHEHVERLCRAQLEAAALFDFCRLPEVFAGHPRDDDHPFPGLYPDANWPQAWSSSSVFSFVQALLGLFPFAPLNALVVDPHLPAWLPDLTLANLRVGAGTATIHFQRQEDGDSTYEVLDTHGSLHVVRQPSPWSLTAGVGERFEDALLSLLPGK